MIFFKFNDELITEGKTLDVISDFAIALVMVQKEKEKMGYSRKDFYEILGKSVIGYERICNESDMKKYAIPKK